MKGLCLLASMVLLSLIGCTSTPTSEVPTTTVSSQLEGITREASSLVHESRTLAATNTALRNVDDVLNRASQDLDRTGRDLISRATSSAIEIVLLVAGLVIAINLLFFFIKRRASRTRAPPDLEETDLEEEHRSPASARAESLPPASVKKLTPILRRQARLKRRSSPGN